MRLWHWLRHRLSRPSPQPDPHIEQAVAAIDRRQRQIEARLDALRAEADVIQRREARGDPSNG